jgi:hypothetical protein
VTDEKRGQYRIGTTALGRLYLRVTKLGMAEDVILERRWPDADSARAWCERIVHDRARPVELQEAQVYTERWRHPKSWETQPVRALPESVQDGRPDGAGGIAWTAVAPVQAPVDGR